CAPAVGLRARLGLGRTASGCCCATARLTAGRGGRGRLLAPRHDGRLAHAIFRTLVITQPEEGRMPNAAVARPFGEPHFPPPPPGRGAPARRGARPRGAGRARAAGARARGGGVSRGSSKAPPRRTGRRL